MGKEVNHSKIQILREGLIGAKVLLWQRKKSRKNRMADPSVQAF